MSELRREQEQRLDELFRQLDGTESPDDCYAILKMAWQEGNDAHDSVQRTEIEGLRAQVGKLEAQLNNAQANIDAHIAFSDGVEQQLAMAQARVEELTKEKDKWAELAGSFTASQHKYLGEMEQLKRQLDQAFGLLRELADLQNGAPLPKYEQEWEACMVNVHKVLSAFEATPEPPRG